MNINDIKKILYKEKPMASWQKTAEGCEHYIATTTECLVVFKIPIDEAKTFSKEEPAQLLIRWLNI